MERLSRQTDGEAVLFPDQPNASEYIISPLKPLKYADIKATVSELGENELSLAKYTASYQNSAAASESDVYKPKIELFGIDYEQEGDVIGDTSQFLPFESVRTARSVNWPKIYEDDDPDRVVIREMAELGYVRAWNPGPGSWVAGADQVAAFLIAQMCCLDDDERNRLWFSAFGNEIPENIATCNRYMSVKSAMWSGYSPVMWRRIMKQICMYATQRAVLANPLLASVVSEATKIGILPKNVMMVMFCLCNMMNRTNDSCLVADGKFIKILCGKSVDMHKFDVSGIRDVIKRATYRELSDAWAVLLTSSAFRGEPLCKTRINAVMSANDAIASAASISLRCVPMALRVEQVSAVTRALTAINFRKKEECARAERFERAKRRELEALKEGAETMAKSKTRSMDETDGSVSAGVCAPESSDEEHTPTIATVDRRPIKHHRQVVIAKPVLASAYPVTTEEGVRLVEMIQEIAKKSHVSEPFYVGGDGFGKGIQTRQAMQISSFRHDSGRDLVPEIKAVYDELFSNFKPTVPKHDTLTIVHIFSVLALGDMAFEKVYMTEFSDAREMLGRPIINRLGSYAKQRTAEIGSDIASDISSRVLTGSRSWIDVIECLFDDANLVTYQDSRAVNYVKNAQIKLNEIIIANDPTARPLSTMSETVAELLRLFDPRWPLMWNAHTTLLAETTPSFKKQSVIQWRTSQKAVEQLEIWRNELPTINSGNVKNVAVMPAELRCVTIALLR